MGSIFKSFGVIAIAAIFIFVNVVTYTVSETEQALVLRLGKVISVEKDAGLKFKLPFVDTPIKIDKRNLEYDLQNTLDITAANEERLIVDAFVRYKVVDAQLYYERLSGGGSETSKMRDKANGRLRQVLEKSLREALGEVKIKEIITTKRAALMSDIKTSTAIEAAKFGINIIDVKIRRADFPMENAEFVYKRMSSDYNQQAALTRAKGDEEARKIRSGAEKTQTEILAAAEEESQITRGVADGKRNAIFAAAYNKDPEFFAFYRSLDAYSKSLDDSGTTLILSPDSEFFRYFNDVSGKR